MSDEQWKRIEPHLPTDVRGVERAEDRRVISGIVHVLKSGCRWCDCPPEYNRSRPRSITALCVGLGASRPSVQLRCTCSTWDDAVVVPKGEALTFVNIERQVHALRTKAPPVQKGPPAAPDLGEDVFLVTTTFDGRTIGGPARAAAVNSDGSGGGTVSRSRDGRAGTQETQLDLRSRSGASSALQSTDSRLRYP